jgi:GWxTD domain-containing protein
MGARLAYSVWIAGVVLLAVGVVGAAAEGPATSAREVRRANEFLAAGDTLAAIHFLERSRLDDHRDAGAAVLLGRLWRERATIGGRLRSQRVLEHARTRFPRDTRVAMELGRTYYAQRFFPDAVACFERALELDPSLCDARYMIGLYHFQNWKRMNEYNDDLAAAQRHLRSVLSCDPDNADAAVRYLVASHALGDDVTGRADELIERFPERPELHLCRGVLAYENGDYALCEQHFARALALLPDDERAPYGNLRSVLPLADGDRYLASPPAVRSTLSRGYWLAADPDPTTEINERLLEHVYRVFLADVHFSNEWTGRRGWRTDRGELFVKFGPPLAVDYTLGGDYRVGKSETWSYVIEGTFLQFPFLDEFLNGDPRIPYAQDLSLHFIRHAPQVSALHPRVLEFPGEVDVTAFRDDDLRGSLYVAMRVDADSVRARLDLGAVRHFVTRGACFDLEWKREIAYADTLPVADLPQREAHGARQFEFVRRLETPFGRYYVASALEDGDAVGRASARADADATRFAGDRLALSDVLLFDAAEEGTRLERAGTGGGLSDAIERGGLRMRPRVGHRYASGDRLHAYAEVYNLAAPGGECAYDIRFAIYPSSEGETSVWDVWRGWLADLFGTDGGVPAVSQRFTRRGAAHSAEERIAIDIDALEPGRYELVVEVTDLWTGESAVSHTPLVKGAARVAGRE